MSSSTPWTDDRPLIRLRSPALKARRELARTFLEEGVEAGLAKLRESRRDSPWILAESLINSLGYFLLDLHRFGDAMEVLRWNVESHPESSNAYHSLAEAQLLCGEVDLACLSYERSIELDPGNLNSRWMLAQLRQPS